MRANKIALENCSMAEIEANRIDSMSVSVCNVSSVTEKEKMAFIKFCGTIREEKKMEVIFMCQMLKFIIECRRFLYVVQFIPMASYSTLCIAKLQSHTAFLSFSFIAMHIVCQQQKMAHISFPNNISHLIHQI